MEVSIITQREGILSQCKCVSNHHNVHLNIIFVNYTSIKLEKKGMNAYLSSNIE